MSELTTIHEVAARILGEGPDPVVRLRLLRDVLRRPDSADEVAGARDAVSDSRWVQRLEREQRPDGSWGRFHTRDYSAKQKTPTTEAGVERALALGLDAAHPILLRAAGYLQKVIQGTTDIPDRAEKNPHWLIAVRLWAGAALAQINPRHPAVDEVWHFWLEVVWRAFSSGAYDPKAEVLTYFEMTGLDMRRGYAFLGAKYHLALLGPRATDLPTDVEAVFVHWLLYERAKIGYLDAPLDHPPDGLRKFRLDAWFTSMELLSRFPSWSDLAREHLDWLWAQRNERGLWDFGPRSDWSVYLPLSESWRKKRSRPHDWSTRALSLLRRYYDTH